MPAARRPDTGGREAFLRPLPGRSPLYRELLYDLHSDPGEATDLAPSRPRRLVRAREGLVAALLRSTPGLRIVARGGSEPARLSVTPRRAAPAGEWTPSAEALERLRALGYVR